MIDADAIKPKMPVVGSEGGQFATVDHLEGRDTIKLTKDKNGRHHYIPTSWVTSIDDKVHVDRPQERAKREWSTSPKVYASGDDDPTHTERVRSQQTAKDPRDDPKRAERLRRH